MEVPWKTKNRTTIWPSNPTTGHIPRENHIQKDTCTPVFIAALFTIARSWKQPKCPSTDEWIKKRWYYIYNGILLSHIKEWNWVICRDVDGPGNCHTEWSKSGREKQILYINAYMWSLEKWYRWSYLQSRNRDRCSKQTYGYQGGRGGDELGDWDWHIYTTMHKMDN